MVWQLAIKFCIQSCLTWLTECRKTFSTTWFSCQDFIMGRFHLKHPDYWLVSRNQKTQPDLWKGSHRLLTGAGCPWDGLCVPSLPWPPPNPDTWLTWGHVILITKASVTSNKSFCYSAKSPNAFHTQFHSPTTFQDSLLAERDLHSPRIISLNKFLSGFLQSPPAGPLPKWEPYTNHVPDSPPNRRFAAGSNWIWDETRSCRLTVKIQAHLHEITQQLGWECKIPFALQRGHWTKWIYEHHRLGHLARNMWKTFN